MALFELYKQVKTDLQLHGGTGILRAFLVFFSSPSFRLLLNYRVGFCLCNRRNPVINLIILYLKNRQILKRGCDISYKSVIGQNVRFPHPLGIVIGEGVIIKDNVKIWQHVTLGSHGRSSDMLTYPTIEANVKIYAGAKVLGAIVVGTNAVVGANAVVINNVPPGATVAGIPAKIIKVI